MLLSQMNTIVRPSGDHCRLKPPRESNIARREVTRSTSINQRSRPPRSAWWRSAHRRARIESSDTVPISQCSQVFPAAIEQCQLKEIRGAFHQGSRLETETAISAGSAGFQTPVVDRARRPT